MMGRNRFLSTKQDVNSFRSNLMLLIHNLHLEGLPLSKLQTEYKKYFHEDVKAESLSKSLGLNLNAIAAKQNKTTATTTEIWLRVFNTPCLYEFFTVEELVEAKANNADEEEEDEEGGMKENLIKCRRGRTVVEMHALAQLGSFRNIESLRYSGRGQGVNEALLDLCDSDEVTNTEEKVKNVPSPDLRILKESNPLKRKLVDLHCDETIEKCETIRKTPPKFVMPRLVPVLSVTPSTPVTQHVPGPEEEVLLGPAIVFQSHTQRSKPQTVKDDSIADNDPDVHSTVTPPKDSPGQLEPATESTSTSTISGGEDKKADPEKHETLVTIQIRNHKGETKVVQYVKVEHKCKRCHKSYPNELLLSRHRKRCVANLPLEYRACETSFSVQELECNNDGNEDVGEENTDSNSTESASESHLEELIVSEPCSNTVVAHNVIDANDEAVYTRTRSSLRRSKQ